MQSTFPCWRKVFVGHKRTDGRGYQFPSAERLRRFRCMNPRQDYSRENQSRLRASPISVALGPGILRNIFDGIERPLKEIAKESGAFIATGSDVAPLDEEALWDVTVKVSVGDEVVPGQIFATLPETDLIEHRCMIPPTLNGTVVDAAAGGIIGSRWILKVRDDKGKLHSLTLTQEWPIKPARPVAERLPISVPLITGQRVFDTLFPIAKGGTAAIPGGFGTGKTMTQHQLAKWCDADIIVYVGCGERGNEMTQVLEEFSELIDPKSNRPLTDRTVLIANTVQHAGCRT